MCCIADCDRYGVIQYEGKLYCRFHAEEAKANDGCIGCDLCTSEPKCCVEGCTRPGIITEVGKEGDALRTYCVEHAWKIDRPDENGLRHNKARWNTEDSIRAHGAGAAIDITQLPIVSESVADECLHELEEGQKSGWRIKMLNKE